MALLQQRKINGVFGAPANPWELILAHGLQAPNGTAITPTKVDVLAVQLNWPGASVALPTRSCVVTAIDAVNVTLRLPPAADYTIPPNTAEVWLHVERVHSYVGYYDRNEPGVPLLPFGGGGPPAGPPGSVFYVDQVVGNDASPGTRAAPCATIAAARALGLALGGAPFVVEVDPATYAETVLMAPGMTLRGAKEGVVITGAGGVGTCIIRPDNTGACMIQNIHAICSGGGQDALRDVDATSTARLNVVGCTLVGDIALGATALNSQGINLQVFDCDLHGIVIHTGDGCWLQHCRVAGDAAIPLVFNNGGANFDLWDCSVVAIGVGAGAHAVQDDAGPSTRINNCLLIAGGGSGLDIANAGVVDLDRSTIAGTASITTAGASTLNMGLCQYDAAIAALAGTTNLNQDCSDLGTSLMAGGAIWAAPTPPTSLLNALDRLAAAVAGLLGAPIP